MDVTTAVAHGGVPTGRQPKDGLVAERFCVFLWELVKSENRFAFKAIIWVS